MGTPTLGGVRMYFFLLDGPKNTTSEFSRTRHQLKTVCEPHGVIERAPCGSLAVGSRPLRYTIHSAKLKPKTFIAVSPKRLIKKHEKKVNSHLGEVSVVSIGSITLLAAREP